MNFFQSAQEVTAAAQKLVQEGAKNFSESIEEAKNTAAELSTLGSATIEQFKNASLEQMQQSSATLDQTIKTVNANTLALSASGAAEVEKLKQQAHDVTQQGLGTLSDTLEQVKTKTLEIGISGVVIVEALKDLPQTAAELAHDMPKIAYRLRNRAGLRTGDAPRSDADVLKLFEKIPGTSKLGANETKIREFLADKHGSHIHPRKQGGSNGADNILWEIGADNIQRGAKAMTGGEQLYIRFYNAVDSIVKNSGTIAKLGLTATGTAILTQAVVTAVSYALDLYRGEITVEEFRDRILEAAMSAGIATPIFFLIFIVVIALFPELALLLSAPAVVTGFNALFGIGIAVPIIQSLIRHLEAGGFGGEISEGYQNLMGSNQ